MFLFALFLMNGIKAQIHFDGVNCNANPNSQGSSWEWDPADAYIDIDPVGSSIPGSSDIDSLWTAVQDQYLIFAFSRAAASTGGAGNAGFKFHFNTDCDTLTGETNFGGADAALFFSIQSGVVQDSTIYEWNGSSYVPSSKYFNPIIGGSSCSDSSDERFFEFRVHVSQIYDLCSGFACGGITITAANVHAGGSFSSIIKDTLLLDVDVFINDRPLSKVAFDPAEICSGDTVSFNALSSTENDSIDTPYDSLVSYEWDFNYVAANGFNPHSSITGPAVEFPFYGYATHSVALRTTDVFGCQDTLSDIEIQSYSLPSVTIQQTLDQTYHLCRNMFYDGSLSSGYAPFASLSFYWELPDGSTYTADTFTKNYSQCIWNYLDYVQLTVTDDKGCVSSATAAPPVPVEIICFKVEERNGMALLQWQTAMEIDNEEFIVERSYDGIEYMEIGRVTGAGNSNDIQDYQFIDEPNKVNEVYYQLIQKDFNGETETYGPIILILKRSDTDLKVYPNPVQSKLTLEYPFGRDKINIQVIDPCGAVLKQLKVEQDSAIDKLEIDISDLAKGTYYVKVGNGRRGYQSRRIEIQ